MSEQRTSIVGVDTGGTFTDFVFVGPDGRVSIYKAPSTPQDPSSAIIDGLALNPPGASFRLVHGTTIATNALLERKGEKTALITTQGCRDVLEIARQTRSKLYDLCPEPRRPLVPKDLRFEVSERLDCEGNVVIDLDKSAVEAALDRVVSQGVISLAVCFLFSFFNSSHEEWVGQAARKRGLFVSISSEIAPEFREYERTSTVCANAYVAPLMERYLTSLQLRLKSKGAANFSIMQSSGGTLRAEEASKWAVKTVLSGPAGGVIAAAALGCAAGISRLITFDMGGTSTDVALIDGEPGSIRTGEIAGLPLLTPMLDIHTVGAGGGSIARLDAGGGLKVGPQSAGADPGPAAYGRGRELTVTDANVFLGTLPSHVFLGGSLPLDSNRVRELMTSFSKRAKMPPAELAEGIVTVVNAQMARAIRHISIERGHDPARYALVSFGGAGGLHACALAESMGIRQVIIPRFPGAFSAMGLAMADVRREYVRSVMLKSESEFAESAPAALAEMRNLAAAEMKLEGVAQFSTQPLLEVQYKGQSYALRVAYSRSLSTVSRAFHRVHRQRYGHCDPSQPVEVVSVGLAISGSTGRVSYKMEPPSELGKPFDKCPILRDGRQVKADLYRRPALGLNQRLEGPAVVLQDDATIWIPVSWSGIVDSASNLILSPKE